MLTICSPGRAAAPGARRPRSSSGQHLASWWHSREPKPRATHHSQPLQPPQPLPSVAPGCSMRGLHCGAGRLGACPALTPVPLCVLPGAELRFLLLADRALLLQARPVRWAVAAAGQLHPLGGRLPLHSHLWHVLCLPVVSTTCFRGSGGECYEGRLPSWERKAPFPSVNDAGHEE